MSKATKHNVASVTKDGKTITFDEPVSVWQALANAPR